MKRRSLFYTKEETEESVVNLTPLIDVVFVVLIMFILVAPLLELDRIKLAMAPIKEEKTIASLQESSPILIRVLEDNTVWLNGVKVSEKKLREHLLEARKKYPGRIPELFHDKRAQFGTYQTVKNALESAGFEELDVILQP
ncbi:MAG: ExbD/TolR family protein [Anaerolineae bacterium]